MKKPAWPLMLRRNNAAIACDMTPSQFDRAVLEGSLPMPILIAGEERWALAAIEEAIGKLSGDPTTDWERQQPGLRNAA